MPDFRRAFATKDQVDPIRHLIATALGWGGNPDKDAVYLNVTVPNNDGKTAYSLVVREVPVDGFWSVSVYNADGYFQKNEYGAYAFEQRHREDARRRLDCHSIRRLRRKHSQLHPDQHRDTIGKPGRRHYQTVRAARIR